MNESRKMKVGVGDTCVWKSLDMDFTDKKQTEILALVIRTWVVRDRWVAEVLLSNGRTTNVLQSQLTVVERANELTGEEAMWMMWGDH